MPAFWSYKEARKFVRTLELSGIVHWWAYVRGMLEGYPALPPEIPKTPDALYGKQGEWVSWRDFLGDEGAIKKWSYTQARKHVQTLGLTSMNEWFEYYRENQKKDPNLKHIPLSVKARYIRVGGWVSWLDFLGSAQRNPDRFMSYENAKKKVHKLGIRNTAEWFERVKGKDSDLFELLLTIPKDPKRVYGKEFKSWQDWFGKGYKRKQNKWATYKEASNYAVQSGITSSTQWMKHVRGELKAKSPLPEGIPKTPHSIYKNEWVNWSHFLQKK